MGGLPATPQSSEPISSTPNLGSDTGPQEAVQYPPTLPATLENCPAQQFTAQSGSISSGAAQYPRYTPMQLPSFSGGSGQHPPQERPTQTPLVHIGEPWKTRLFDCQENSSNAVMTAILPCVTFGQIAEILDGGETTCPLGSFLYLLMMPALCSAWILGSTYRAKLRKKFNLVQAPYEDWVSHIFCPCCSLCQEFRELQQRNIDPALGWNGILAQQAMQQRYQEQVMYPPQKQSMS